ncbi:MAG: hypothetical protein O2945_19245 [Planctomycetota bacterium]|nr:hypothetical protein [Planctomycetota bacterium]
MEIVLFWLLCGVASSAILSRYNKAGIGCLLGILLGPIGILIAWTMRDDGKQNEMQAMHRQMAHSQHPRTINHPQPIAPPRDEYPCPFCAEPILSAARLCKHCGSDLTATSKPEQPQESQFTPFDFDDVFGDTQDTNPPQEQAHSIRFKCSCGSTLSAKPEYSGRVVSCPRCQQQLTVP